MVCKLCCCCGCCCCSAADTTNTPINEAPKLPEIPNGSILVFINPHSGSGKGVEVFENNIKPKLEESRIKYEIVVTERPNHAKEIVKLRADLLDFNAIIIVSGDGLIFEVINGLLEREDGAEVLQKVAFGIVPSGSGNGLLASVFHTRNLPQALPDFTTTAYSIIPDLTTRAFPVNLTHIETDQEHFGSFLSMGWGLLADIDIESERYRKLLGSHRFFVGALIRVFGSLRTYRGKLSFLEAGPSESSQPDSFVVYERSPIIDRCPSYRSHKSTAVSSIDSEAGGQTDAFWRQHHKGPNGSFAPALKDPIPMNWTVIEDEFLFVYVMSLSHISPGNNYAPSTKLCDDRFQLTYALKKDIPSRMAIAKFLDSIEKGGKHLEFDFCKTISVTSFRLEPLDKRSYIVVDGEVINTSRLQATVTDVNCFVMSQ